MEEQVSHQDKVIGSNPIIGTKKCLYGVTDSTNLF